MSKGKLYKLRVNTHQLRNSISRYGTSFVKVFMYLRNYRPTVTVYVRIRIRVGLTLCESAMLLDRLAFVAICEE